MTQDAIAHAIERGAKLNLLREHLEKVGRMAARFAEPWDSESFASLAGRWHDLGKYSADFQQMIRAATGIDPNLETLPGRVDHSSAGALWAKERFGALGEALAFVIAGHHAGLADKESLSARLLAKKERLAVALADGLAERDGILNASPPTPPAHLLRLRGDEQKLGFELWTRLLFSALVDADSLDTEAFHEPEKAAERAFPDDVDALLERLESYLGGLSGHGPVIALRRQIQEAARERAKLPTGLFTLTVPTGGGKTFASTLFALHHARQHGLRRVIIVPPFTSIIEQTAEVLRKALGQSAVLEHHSALDGDKESTRNRLAAENWDAPVVVTTAVQFFESLFANRRNRCRKLHNITQSVVVLDEAQTLPSEYLSPILHVLKTLARDYRCSVVLSTATQPALGKRSAFPIGLEDVRELAPDPAGAVQAVRRVKVRWPNDLDEPTDWHALAKRTFATEQSLAIVHRKDDAVFLTREMDSLLADTSTHHLTGNLCAAHRASVLKDVRRALAANEPVRVVSTQLVEAGVDVDFPLVFRALAGLDSLAQAAGRCNREGKRETGWLEVFVSPSTAPLGQPRTGLEVAKVMLRNNPELDLFDPATFDEYFSRLLALSRRFDAHGIQELRKSQKFEEVASRFRLIDNGRPLVVPYGKARDILDEIRSLEGPDRRLLRKLQRFTVNVPVWAFKRLEEHGAVDLVSDTVATLAPTHEGLYDARFGLQITGDISADCAALVI